MKSLLLIAFGLGLWSSMAAEELIPGEPWKGGEGTTEVVGEIMGRVAENLPSETPRIAPRLLRSRKSLAANPAAPETSGWPVSAKASTNETDASQLGSSFLAVHSADADGIFPPDTMGDIGPTQILVAVNGRIRVFDRNGTKGALDTSLDNFFRSVRSGASAAGLSALSYTTDPRVRFDRLSRRWFIVMIDVGAVPNTFDPFGLILPTALGPNRVLIAVSSGETITSESQFTFFQFQHDMVGAVPNEDTGAFADYPTLGVDRSALYIGVNVFSAASFYSGTTGFVVNKAELLNGRLQVTAFRQLASVLIGGGPFTPQGVDNDDPASTEGYFIGVDQDQQGLLILRRVVNPGGAPSISGNIPLTVPLTAPPSAGVQPPGSSAPLDDLDNRLMSARMHRGRLVAVHNIGVNRSGIATSGNPRDGIRWYEITNLASSPVLSQSGTLFDPATTAPRHFWMPGIAMSGQQHLVVSGNAAGSADRPSVVLAARYAIDPPGELRAPISIIESASSYDPGDGNPHRWGDYSVVSLDPNDDMTFWGFQEYVDTTDSWAIRVFQFKAPPPPGEWTVSPDSLPAGSSNRVIQITAVAEDARGFYDPDASYPKHLSAQVSGSGVRVASVRCIDPLHLELTVSVDSNAVPGVRDLTVNNPDGQSVTRSGALTVGSGLPRITISRIATGVRLNWNSDRAFAVQSSSDLENSSNWILVSRQPAANGSDWQLDLPVEGNLRFFRLVVP